MCSHLVRLAGLSLTVATAASASASAQTDTLYTFDPPPFLFHGWGAVLTGLHDLDGDGVPELGVGAPDHGGGPALTVHSGADGAFLYTVTAPFAALFHGQAVVSVADPAGDGVPDVVVLGARSGAANSTDGWIGVFSGTDGSLLRQFTPPAGTTIVRRHAIALDDVDGDGSEDVLCLVRQGLDAFQLFSSATGAPLYPTLTLTGMPETEFAAIDDHDGDGVRDFAAVGLDATGRHVELRSGATGLPLRRLTPRSIDRFTNNGEPLVSVEDADGDGLRDLALGGVFEGYVEVFSTRDGSTLAHWSCANPATPCFGSRVIEVPDLDGDGRADLLALESQFSSTGTLTIYALSPASGAILFAQPIASSSGGYSGADRLAAFDGADPTGLPTFALFEDVDGHVALRRHAPEIGVSTCGNPANSTGQPAVLRALGLAVAPADRVVLEVSSAPPGRATVFVYSDTAGSAPLGGGTLCVGGASIVRSPVGVTGAAGSLSHRVDVPGSGIVAGTTWTFQAVLRDSVPAGIGLSNAVMVGL